MDLWLLYLLALPAIVVTADGGLIMPLRKAVMSDAGTRGVVSVESFNTAVAKGDLESLRLDMGED